MTVRERVLSSRLILKLDGKETYAKQIGLSYVVSMCEADKDNRKTVQGKRMKDK